MVGDGFSCGASRGNQPCDTVSSANETSLRCLPFRTMRKGAAVILICLVNLLQQHQDDYTDVDIQVKSVSQIPDVYIQIKTFIDYAEIKGQGSEQFLEEEIQMGLKAASQKMMRNLLSRVRDPGGGRAGGTVKGWGKTVSIRTEGHPGQLASCPGRCQQPSLPSHLLMAPCSCDVLGNDLGMARFHPVPGC